MKLSIPSVSTIKGVFLIFLSLLITIIFGCKDQDNFIEFKSFPDEYILVGKKLDLPIQSPALNMRLFDSLLFIMNPYDKMFFIHIYNKNTFQHYKSFHRKGNGPNEYKSAGTFSLDKKSRILWVTDFNKIRIVGYYIDSLLEFPNYKPAVIISLPKKLHPMMGMENYNSELFAIPDPAGEIQLFFFNRKGEEVSVMNKMDFKDIDNSFFSDLTRTHNSIHAGKNKIVMVYRYFDRMIIRDLKDNSFIETIGPDHIDLQKQLELYDHERLYGYDGKPKFDDNYIYGLYRGTPAAKVDFELGKVSAVYSKKIHIFNWNGKPVMRLNLDHEISSFIIDRKNNRIIAFSVDEVNSLVSYDISHIPELNQ